MPTNEDKGTAINTTRGGVPEGIHRMVVVDSDEKEGGSGYPYWSFVCMVVGGEWDGETIFTNVSLSPQARFRMDEWLDAHAIGEGEEVYHQDFIGKTFRAKVVRGEYQGRKRPEIDGYLPDAKPSRKRTAPKMEATEAEPSEDGSDVTTDKGLPDDAKPTRRRRRK